MVFQKPSTTTVNEMLDKFAVKELIEFERFCRDNALWEQMHQCFAEDSRVEITWYSGDGHGFVEASRSGGLKAPHKLNSTLVWLGGNRAVAVTMGSIQVRKQIGEAEYDLESQVRFLYKAQKLNGEWKIISMNCIYEKDALLPIWPKELERGEVVRTSYQALATVLAAEGHTINMGLPGDDKPELVNHLLDDSFSWLGDNDSKDRREKI